MFSMSTLPRSAAFHTGVTSPCIRYQQYSVMQLKLTWWHSSKCNITILWDEIPAQSKLYSVRIIIMTHTNPQWTHNVHWTGLNQVWKCVWTDWSQSTYRVTFNQINCVLHVRTEEGVACHTITSIAINSQYTTPGYIVWRTCIYSSQGTV